MQCRRKRKDEKTEPCQSREGHIPSSATEFAALLIEYISVCINIVKHYRQWTVLPADGWKQTDQNRICPGGAE